MGNNMTTHLLMKKIVKYIESLTTYKIIIILDEEVYQANPEDAMTIHNKIIKRILS
jgi:hypothetical protein|tara:strand:+ start:655 stop:822 length:168 start_codon:yes stop_codon:yes gene_type:complete